MPVFTHATDVNCPAAKAWDFLIHPANLVQVTPPELGMQLVEGPSVLAQGARIVLLGRRWGVSQRIVSEVTAWEEGSSFRDEQREGPFKKWAHTHRVEPAGTGTRLYDEINFEPPGGMLGFLVTGARVLRELETVFAYREKKIKELLEGN